MTRADFIALCGSTQEAMAVETSILGSGRECLPACARIVADGGEAGTDYWIWLCAQAAQMRAEGREVES